jgi:hypothetical protein
VSAFLWSLMWAVLVWAFLLGIGVSNAMAVLVGALVLGGSFVYIRTSGGPRARRRRR